MAALVVFVVVVVVVVVFILPAGLLYSFDGMKDLWCSSTAQLLINTDMSVGRRISMVP